MSTPDARAAILAAIANANANANASANANAHAEEGTDALPEPMEVFGSVSDGAQFTDRSSLARRFRDELARIGGETRFVAHEEDLPGAIAALLSERGLKNAPVDDASADYALLRAESLLADTGSAVVIERSANRRLAPYLPRTSIIVGDAAALHAHMTADALAPIFEAAGRADRGEAVIITGPSRTADIEKTLVLGAHGPRDVVVFIVNVEGE